MSKGGHFRWRSHKARKRLIRAFFSTLYLDTHRDTGRSIMVAGTARSGTTWVADLIASQIPCRVLFEPFHSKLVEDFQQFNYFQYMRPDDQNEELRAYCHRILSGDIRHRWIDREVETLFPQYRIVKDIRANLFLRWLHSSFPEVPLLFVMRHPCAVVLSRMQLGWWTDKDIEPFLSQPNLIEDFLADKMEIISRAKTAEQKHAVVWCISNLVPLRQFKANGLNVVFYEDLCLQPETEIPQIFRAIKHTYHNSVFEKVDRPSTTTIPNSAIVTGDDKIGRWQNELTQEQIRSILAVVEAFGLSYLYGGSSLPLTTAWCGR